MENYNEYEEKQRALFEYQRVTKDLQNEKQKKRLKFVRVSLLIIIAIIIHYIFFGALEFNNFFAYSSKKARYYKITINGKQVPASYRMRHKIPIIPFLINFNSYYTGNSDIKGNDNGNSLGTDLPEKYLMEIETFSCYYFNVMVECKNNTQEMKKNNDTKFTNLTITNISDGNKTLYDGKFFKDITSFVKEKGQYYIGIKAKYGFFNETDIYFYFNIL